MNTERFSTTRAFSRSLGWLTEAELSKIAKSHVGIIGMGGVGGQYAEILARLGVGRFTICDPDTFAIENTNRQNECKVSNYGKNKAEVISKLILDINPEAQVNVIPGEMSKHLVDGFCNEIDIYLDGLDFFEIDLRLSIFKKMHELGKPAVTVAPIGMGSACLVFKKNSMSFDNYFGLHTTTDVTERSLMFTLGLAPSLQHRHYIQEQNRVDLANRKTPSLPVGVYACAASVATVVIKLLLARGKVLSAPWSVHYDAYQMKIEKKYVPWGYRNPLQRLKLVILRRMLKKP
jgi:molybdopterin/thiamine biosynthesis adenylyltransferase